ncbi:MAG: class I SAM-dependent methyltransferase family protein [Candidatus Hydrothermarchaeales archaeon]
MTRKQPPLEEILKDVLPEELLEFVPRSYDTIGDIIVMKIPEELEDYKKQVGEAFIKAYPYIKTVLNQTGPIENEFRTRPLEFISGENKRSTLYKEFDCIFHVDVEKAYFSPRLSNERGRIMELVKDGEKILNMFAGIGTFSIIIARHKRTEVYSVEKNPEAYHLMMKNIERNKLKGEVKPVLEDAKNFIKEGYFDRIIMPLPERANEFLEQAFANAKNRGIIHYHDFCREFEEVEEKLARLKLKYKINDKKIIRSYGPGIYHVVMDLEVNK